MRSLRSAVAIALVAGAACASQVAAQAAAEPAPAAVEPPPVEPAVVETTPVQSLPVPVAAAPARLSDPDQVSTRQSAYSLPARTWSFDVGALGISSGDAFARLGVGYGIGAGLQVDLNLLHWAVGLFNLGLRWQFVDAKHFDLGVNVGAIYGHGDWFWLATAEKLASAIDVLSFPMALNASVQANRWLQLDLGLHYTHSQLWGSIGEEGSAYADAEIGVRQFAIRPGVRFYVSDATSVDFNAALPAYTAAPTEGSVETQLPGVIFGGTRTAGYRTVPFENTWKLEFGVRSRLTTGLYGTMRLHYGQIANRLYGAKIYPSFDVEWRL